MKLLDSVLQAFGKRSPDTSTDADTSPRQGLRGKWEIQSDDERSATRTRMEAELVGQRDQRATKTTPDA